MKSKNSDSLAPLISGVVRVEDGGRVGSYFFTSGWFEGFTEDEGRFEYHLATHPDAVVPDSAFFRADPSNSARTRFLHLFWIKGGQALDVSVDEPMTLTVRDKARNQPGPRGSVESMPTVNFERLISGFEATGSKEIWGSRMVVEMMRHCGPDERDSYLKTALDRLGWQTFDEQVHSSLTSKHWEDNTREYLYFQCHCIALMDTRYLPMALRTKFIDLVNALQVSEGDRHLAHEIIRQLARFEPEMACEFAYQVITTLDYDRGQLATALRHCFPQDSQWWIQHALLNEGLGPEQVADALNCAGTAAAMEGNEPLAKLSYEAALISHPEARGVAWNAGWFWAGVGNMEKAGLLFEKVGRHYPHTSLTTRWPQVKGIPWPIEPADVSGFALPPGVTEWPRITVVTPSFNQGCFIEETLLSVFNQCYPNLQYIVVDGNSTDDTREVLERFRGRLDHLIIESDNGQTEAINKGLRLADGELVAWLNSDDMYAPGTLHTAALRWLENHADLIAGTCVEHVERRIQLFNRPAANNSDFNLPQLARIFKYWLKGYYFYQPEVFFSKRILDKVGLLDESLYYSMDYDLWVRFAKAGAILDVVGWPFAFFRKHEQQKTTNLVDCVEEQAKVRSRHYKLLPDEEQGYRIRRKIEFLKQKKGATVGVLTRRLGKIFSPAVQRELDRFCEGYTCFLSDDERDPRIANADAVILLAHVQEDTKVIEYLRGTKEDRLIVAWFWDNHHHLFENQATAEAVDIVLPGHALYGEYLRSDQSIHGGHVPLCVTQWARQDVEQWFTECGNLQRSGELYGGFVEYTFEPGRTQFLHRVMEMLPKHALSILSEANLHSYFGRSEKDRFAEWCRYQVSLVLPLRNDLSQRIFDALLAGQIPLVPDEIADMDSVIPPELQASLPVIRFSMKDPESCRQAYQKALAHLAAEGADGPRTRHAYALENHMFSSRINTILQRLVTLDVQA